MKMIFCGQEGLTKVVVEGGFCVFRPHGSAGWGLAAYAISSGESFVPVAKMTPQWFSNLFDGDIKAGLPLEAVWTYVDFCCKYLLWSGLNYNVSPHFKGLNMFSVKNSACLK